MNTYEQMAVDFLKNHNAKMVISHVGDGYGGWKYSPMTHGWLYRVRIDRNGRTYSFPFNDSYHNMTHGKRPNKYDVLACIEKWEPSWRDTWDFADEFGYEIKDRDSYNKVERTRKAVEKEYRNVVRIFGDCLEALREIV